MRSSYMKKENQPEDNLDDLTRLNMLLLRSVGLLAFPGRPLDYWVSRLLRLFANVCSLVITSMYGCSVVRNLLTNGKADVQVVSDLVGLCSLCMRIFIIYANRERLVAALRTARYLWLEVSADTEWQHSVRKFVTKSNLVTRVYFYLSIATMLLYVSSSQVLRSKRVLPYPYYQELDSSSEWFNLALIVQVIGMSSICVTAPGIDTVVIFQIMFACGLFESLGKRLQRLEKLVEQGDELKMRYEIVRCVVFHQKIIEFCKNVDELTRWMFMALLTSTTYNMSLIGLTLVGKDPDKFKCMTVLIIYIIQLFTCQWAPDVLVSESLSLAKSMYFIPLTNNNSKKIGQFIWIFIIRSQRPIQLTAGGYINLSMECFRAIIASVLSLFTVLRSMK